MRIHKTLFYQTDFLFNNSQEKKRENYKALSNQTIFLLDNSLQIKLIQFIEEEKKEKHLKSASFSIFLHESFSYY